MNDIYVTVNTMTNEYEYVTDGNMPLDAIVEYTKSVHPNWTSITLTIVAQELEVPQ